jgi:hypothetical protein
MFMETGSFGGTLLSDGTFSASFAARVVIAEDEFPALGLGEHEQSHQLPSCFHWCLDRLGHGGTRWAPDFTRPSAVILYFQQVDDAVAFVAEWNACKPLAHRETDGASSKMIHASAFGEAFPGLFAELDGNQASHPGWPVPLGPVPLGVDTACNLAGPAPY